MTATEQHELSITVGNPPPELTLHAVTSFPAPVRAGHLTFVKRGLPSAQRGSAVEIRESPDRQNLLYDISENGIVFVEKPRGARLALSTQPEIYSPRCLAQPEHPHSVGFNFSRGYGRGPDPTTNIRAFRSFKEQFAPELAEGNYRVYQGLLSTGDPVISGVAAGYCPDKPCLTLHCWSDGGEKMRASLYLPYPDQESEFDAYQDWLKDIAQRAEGAVTLRKWRITKPVQFNPDEEEVADNFRSASDFVNFYPQRMAERLRVNGVPDNDLRQWTEAFYQVGELSYKAADFKNRFWTGVLGALISERLGPRAWRNFMELALLQHTADISAQSLDQIFSA